MASRRLRTAVSTQDEGRGVERRARPLDEGRAREERPERRQQRPQRQRQERQRRPDPGPRRGRSTSSASRRPAPRVVTKAHGYQSPSCTPPPSARTSVATAGSARNASRATSGPRSKRGPRAGGRSLGISVAVDIARQPPSARAAAPGRRRIVAVRPVAVRLGAQARDVLAVVRAGEALGVADHVLERDARSGRSQRVSRSEAASWRRCRGSRRRCSRRARSRSPSSSARPCAGRSSRAGRAGRSCRRCRSTKCAQVAGQLVQLGVGRVGRERVPGRREALVDRVVLDDHPRVDAAAGGPGRSGGAA